MIDGDTTNYAIGELVLDFKENGMIFDTDELGDTDTTYYTLTGVMLKVSDFTDMSDPTEFTIQNLTSTDLNFFAVFPGDNGAYEKMSFSAKR